MDVNNPGSSTTRSETTPLRLLNLATVAFIVAWLAVACYAMAHLISH
jgi:hypothetical protein